MSFQTFARDGELTEYEIKRLKYAENSERFTSLLLETTHWGTGLAFLVVLFYQAGAITNLPFSWVWFSATVGSCTPSNTSDKDTLYNLAVASAFFYVFNAVLRLALVLVPVSQRRKASLTPKEHATLFIGVLATVVDPWNGLLLVENTLDPEGDDLTPTQLLTREIGSDILLVFFTNITQLTIEIIYSVVTRANSTTSIAWFVAIFVNSIHALSQVYEIIYLIRRYPDVKNSKAVLVTKSPV